MHRLWNFPDGNGALVLAFVGVSIVCVLVATYGHANIVGAQRLVLPSMGILIIMGYIVFAPKFNAHFHHGPYVLGSFWATWLLSAVTAASLPISYSPFVNDYARYISPHRWSRKRIAFAAGGSMFIGCAVGTAVCDVHRHRDAGECFFLGGGLDPTQPDLVRVADRIDRHRRQFCPRRGLHLRQRTRHIIHRSPFATVPGDSDNRRVWYGPRDSGSIPVVSTKLRWRIPDHLGRYHDSVDVHLPARTFLRARSLRRRRRSSSVQSW